MTQRLVLDEIVDPFEARVVVERDPDGVVRAARFDLTGLPRVDSLLVGQPVADVPGLVERLCGICPAAHHLAGVRALEALTGSCEIPPTAIAVRRLLHHASAVATYAVRLMATSRDDALLLRSFAKTVAAAVGSPGHFPATAVPGGVVSAVTVSDRDRCATLAAAAVEVALRVTREQVGREPKPPRFSGADVALADADGFPDLLGDRLRAVAADGSVLVSGARFSDFDDIIGEALPGQSAPRPFLISLGPDRGGYRVGPVAQLRVGTLRTPMAATLQEDWLRSGGDAAGARAVMMLHSAEVVADLLSGDQLVTGEFRVAVPPPSAGVLLAEARQHPQSGVLVASLVNTTQSARPHEQARGRSPQSGVLLAEARQHPQSARPHEQARGRSPQSGVGVGMVDGPRGLLIHRYRAGADGRLAQATILTPTAQNEYWLAELLGEAVARGQLGNRLSGVDDRSEEHTMEWAIREADPCLPCTSAPVGAMVLRVDDIRVGEGG